MNRKISQKRYNQSEKGKLRTQKHRKSVKGKITQKKANKKYLQSLKGKNIRKKYYKNNPKQVKARYFITNLLKISDFTRDICTICGKPNAEFHHENYDLSNFGYWFCKEHHVEIHNGGLNICQVVKLV